MLPAWIDELSARIGCSGGWRIERSGLESLCMVGFWNPHKDWAVGERRGVANGWKKTETLGASRGPYIAQRCLSVVPTGCRYYRRSLEIEIEMSYRYTDSGSVLPGGSGSTDTASVLPWNASNSNSELLSVLPTLCRLYRQFDQILRLIKSLDWDCWHRGVWTCREPIGVGD
jgi:hypothetical protein